MDTPIVTKLLQLSKLKNDSFHALPISGISNLNGVGISKILNTFGKKYLENELTITGELFDSFFYPKLCIKESQMLTAKQFGAKDTLFITCGTTVANHIVVDALINNQTHVLFDRNSHQSLHFALDNHNAQIKYIQSKSCCAITDRVTFNISEIINQIKKAQQNKTPFDVIILTASSYDGVIYNINEIVTQIVNIAPSITFIIDEAWSAAYYFHPVLYKYTAGFASSNHPNVNIIATQSAHKSLLALRQGSYIHSFANEIVTANLYKSRLKYHSTSPSYPILASLELARSHIKHYGETLLSNAMKIVTNSIILLQKDKELKQLFIPSIQNILSIMSGGIAVEDPLKIHFNIQALGIEPAKLQKDLFIQDGLYFNRFNKKSILLNIHISTKKSNILKLFKFFKATIQNNNKRQSRFIISYPPGIPICTPQENLDIAKMQAMNENMNTGNLILHID